MPEPSGPFEDDEEPGTAHPSVMMLLVAPFSMPSLICWFTLRHQLLEVGPGDDVRLPDRAGLEVAHGVLVRLGGGLVGHLALGDHLVHLPRQRLDLVQLGHGLLVLAQRGLRAPQRLVLRRLADLSAELLRLVPDHDCVAPPREQVALAAE